MLHLKMFELQQYERQDGFKPFEQWFKSLDNPIRSKVTVALARLESGNDSNVKWFRGIGEFKINQGPGYRIYLAKVGNQILLLLGGGEKSNQQRDIEQAIENLKDYKRNK
jgi:putative addiction module killer protein